MDAASVSTLLCPDCPETFASVPLLIAHVEEKHVTTDVGFFCSYVGCREIFYSATDMEFHFDFFHLQSQLLCKEFRQSSEFLYSFRKSVERALSHNHCASEVQLTMDGTTQSVSPEASISPCQKAIKSEPTYNPEFSPTPVSSAAWQSPPFFKPVNFYETCPNSSLLHMVPRRLSSMSIPVYSGSPNSSPPVPVLFPVTQLSSTPSPEGSEDHPYSVMMPMKMKVKNVAAVRGDRRQKATKFPASYPCATCNKRFTRRYDVARHARTVHRNLMQS